MDIFDNVFDWGIKLSNMKFSSDPKNLLQKHMKNDIDPLKVKKGSHEYERAKKFKFRSYKDVKLLIYMAYSKKLIEKKQEEEQKLNELAEAVDKADE